MTDSVIDTNVWVMVDKPIGDIQTEAEIVCQEQCLNWLKQFLDSTDHLVVDTDYGILGEYRANLRRGIALGWLNDVERKPRDLRLLEIMIEWDSDGYAMVPPHLAIPDKDDRKFIAVALAYNPTPPIVNATDTDWTKDKAKLDAGGIVIQEICEDYIKAAME